MAVIGEDVSVVATEDDRAQQSAASSDQRGGRRKLLASLLVVLAVAAATVLLTPRTNDTIRPVDYTDELAEARAAAPYPVLVPVGLGRGWTPTSVMFTRYQGASRWHLGLVTPDGDTVGVEQSDGDRDEFVDLLTGNGRPDGVLEVGTLVWSKRFSPSRNLRALVLDSADSVVVVAGMTSYDTLAELALALHAG
jgi:hypothetical protein